MPAELDILTTSVGRSLIRQTYSSTLDRLEFDGPLHVRVVIDPAYGVTAEEIGETCDSSLYQLADERVMLLSLGR